MKFETALKYMKKGYWCYRSYEINKKPDTTFGLVHICFDGSIRNNESFFVKRNNFTHLSNRFSPYFFNQEDLIANNWRIVGAMTCRQVKDTRIMIIINDLRGDGINISHSETINKIYNERFPGKITIADTVEYINNPGSSCD